MSIDAVKGEKLSVPPRSEKVVDFSPIELQAPFLLRLGAMIIDYMLLMILPVLGLFSGKVIGDLEIVSDRTLWLFSALLFFGNIVVLPLLAGRSFGKMLTGLRIVNKDGTRPEWRWILFRQTVGLLVSALTLGLGFLLSVVNGRGRALHDLLAGTVVIHGHRRIL